MSMSGGKDDGEPMMEMNTTPLIDVMLVLLIMFIITIPPITHAVDIDLPSSNQDDPPEVIIEPVKNMLIVTVAGETLWNGTAITNEQLLQTLKATKGMKPEPELQFSPDTLAAYDPVNKVIKVIRESEVSNVGFVGNSAYAQFDKAARAPN